MPKIRSSRTKRAPEGFDEIEPTLKEFQQKMKDGKFIIFVFLRRGCQERSSKQLHCQPCLDKYLTTFSSLNYLAENDPHEGKRKVEALWPVFRIHHQRSRYVYELFYKRKAISKELYEYLLKQGYADGNLIAKWKKVKTTLSDRLCFPIAYFSVLLLLACLLTFMSLIMVANDYVY